jgi:hypothetical protein
MSSSTANAAQLTGDLTDHSLRLPLRAGDRAGGQAGSNKHKLIPSHVAIGDKDIGKI